MPGPPLVTGATGFAGSHLVDHLLEHEPRVAAWGHTGGRDLPAGAHPRIEWTAVDVTDREAVALAIGATRPSRIFHCAGMADVHAAWQSATPALRINALGTHHVLEGVRRADLDIPVLVVGSALVYQASPAAIDESHPLRPSSPYGISKLAQEMAALRAEGCRVFLVRPFNHAGPRQGDAYVTSSFARQIAEIEAGLREPVLRVGNLEARRDITDVRDTVRAYARVVSSGRERVPYNVCSGTAHRVADLLQRLVAGARVEIRVQTDPDRLRPSDNPVVLGSFARLQQDTGWTPQIPIERTLDDLLDYWRAVTAGRAAAKP
ncbi:MAG TPA: GDP-mannose 4,6-dehydratase [Vicinamibacterales bacterium]|nr:GDP-mannose 4,6-dehydratase [Vicinamibacterales bacterium]